MPRKKKLTPREANIKMKGCMLFLLASMESHGLIDKIQWEHWIGEMKSIGTINYTLEEYDGSQKSFDELLKGGK